MEARAGSGGALVPSCRSATPDSAGETTTAPAGEADTGRYELRRFRFGGAELWVHTNYLTLPAEPSLIHITSTVIEDDSGAILCVGGVDESSPPECSGIRLADFHLDPASSRSAGGVRWATVTDLFHWPAGPDGLTIAPGARPPAFLSGSNPPSRRTLGLPDRGQPIFNRLVGETALANYRLAHPDTTNIVYVTSGGHHVLQVRTDAVAAATEALSRDGLEPCIEPVQFSHDELDAVYQSVRGQAEKAPHLHIAHVSCWGATNRVEVTLSAPGRDTIETILETTPNSPMLRFVSRRPRPAV
ncbi:MAG: hypothetical protein GY745_14775 [Actinomycetia bacterium]|nr:hypothetical protein [Actinomycetes bacterium]